MDMKEVMASVGVMGVIAAILLAIGLVDHVYEIVDKPELLEGKPFEVDNKYFVCKETGESVELNKLKLEIELLKSKNR